MRESLVGGLRAVCANVPYPVGVIFARWLAGNALARRLVFSRDIRQIQEIYVDACAMQLDESAVQSLLMARILKRWRFFQNLEKSDRGLGRYVRINGLDKVRALNESGRCVVLASAYYFGVNFVALSLARLGVDFHTFRKRRFFTPLSAKSITSLKMAATFLTAFKNWPRSSSRAG